MKEAEVSEGNASETRSKATATATTTTAAAAARAPAREPYLITASSAIINIINVADH